LPCHKKKRFPGAFLRSGILPRVPHAKRAFPGQTLANENQLLNAGVYYGAGASEASMCRDEHVIVVGGGNSAGQAVMHFSRCAGKVTMLVGDASLAASLSTYLLVRVTQTTNVEILYHAQVTELKGETAPWP
jgi:thioredoxin reductase (NADPH)